jgi:hypothetical protein
MKIPSSVMFALGIVASYSPRLLVPQTLTVDWTKPALVVMYKGTDIDRRRFVWYGQTFPVAKFP